MPPGYIHHPLSIFKFMCANMKCHACCLWSLKKNYAPETNFKKSPQMILNSNYFQRETRHAVSSFNGRHSVLDKSTLCNLRDSNWSTKTVCRAYHQNTLNSTNGEVTLDTVWECFKNGIQAHVSLLDDPVWSWAPSSLRMERWQRTIEGVLTWFLHWICRRPGF